MTTVAITNNNLQVVFLAQSTPPQIVSLISPLPQLLTGFTALNFQVQNKMGQANVFNNINVELIDTAGNTIGNIKKNINGNTNGNDDVGGIAQPVTLSITNDFGIQNAAAVNPLQMIQISYNNMPNAAVPLLFNMIVLAGATLPAPTSAAVVPTSAAVIPTSVVVPKAYTTPAVNNVQQPAAAPAAGLSTGAKAGIAVGVVLLGIFVLLAVIPIIYARVKKDDPRVQRLTNRFTKAFGR